MSAPWIEKAQAHWLKSHQGLVPQEQGFALFEREITQHVEDEAILKILQHLYPDQPRQLLDLGSGYGDFAITASQHQWEAHGIECDGKAVELAKERAENENQRVSFIEADARRLPYKISSFDVVTCINVLEHCQDPKVALRECARVLKPGGHLFILAPNYLTCFREPHYQLLWLPMLPKGIAAPYVRAAGRNPDFLRHLHNITFGDIQRILRSHALKVTSTPVLKLTAPSLIHHAFHRKMVEWASSIGLTRALGWLWPNRLWPVISLVAKKSETSEGGNP